MNTDAPPSPARDRSPFSSSWSVGDVGVLGGALILLVLFRLHAFSAPLETDECNYAYMGQQLAGGARLYVDVWDHQPPGIFALTAVIGTIFGFGPGVFKILAIAATAITLSAVYTLCRTHLGRSSAALAAVLFALAASDPGMAGEGCNREIYMNALAAWALVFALRDRWWSLAAAGLCLGLASLLKTVSALPWLVMLAAMLMTSRPINARALLQRTLAFSLGPIVLWATTFGYFAATDRLHAFLEAVFRYNLEYGQMDLPLWRKLTAFFDAWTVFRSLLPLWCIGTLGYFALPWRRAPREATIILAFLIGNFLAVCLPGKFWPHYYLLLLPPLVVGAAALYARLPFAPRKVYAGGLIAMVFAGQFIFYLAQDPETLAAPRYGPRMLWARDLGRRVAEVTAPDDYVYINHVDVGVYYYSDRRCPTRYTLATQLLGDDAAAAARRTAFLEDLRRHPPRLILLTNGLPYIAELDVFIRERGYVKVGEDPGRLDVLCAPAQPIREIDWRWAAPSTDQPRGGVPLQPGARSGRGAQSST